MIAVLFRFFLACLLLASFTAIALYAILRWVIPLLFRSRVEENKAYMKWCKAWGINQKPSGKATKRIG